MNQKETRLSQSNTHKCDFEFQFSGFLNAIHPEGRYRYTFATAKGACESQGATLATLDQLTEVFDLGREYCTCGWLADGLVWTAMHEKDAGCRNVVGVVVCEGNTHGDAFCLKP